MKKNQKTKAVDQAALAIHKTIDILYPQKRRSKKSLVAKVAVGIAALMGIGAAIAQAAKGGDQ
jgi:hypothetical protein